MVKTYTEVKTADENFVTETDTFEKKKDYHKQWLIDEIARLNAILDEFA